MGSRGGGFSLGWVCVQEDQIERLDARDHRFFLRSDGNQHGPVELADKTAQESPVALDAPLRRKGVPRTELAFQNRYVRIITVRVVEPRDALHHFLNRNQVLEINPQIAEQLVQRGNAKVAPAVQKPAYVGLLDVERLGNLPLRAPQGNSFFQQLPQLFLNREKVQLPMPPSRTRALYLERNKMLDKSISRNILMTHTQCSF